MKYILLSLLLAVSVATGYASSRSQNLGDQSKLNSGVVNGQAARLGNKVIFGTERTLRAYYDYSVQGGAAAAITLKDALTNEDAVLPQGAIVRNCVIDVVTAPSPGPSPSASPSPTLAFGTGQAANDLKAATAYASITSLVACVPVGSAATAIKLTADRTMTMTVAAGTLAAGKIYVIVHNELSNTL